MIPLSFAQQRLWFLHQFQGSSATFNVPLLLRMRGELDASALRVALADVIDRHESLRTLFSEVDGVGQQTILDRDNVELVFDLREVAHDGLAAEVSEAAAYCFDLAREIPVRATLFKLGADEHALLLLQHHIASDAGSIAP